MRELSELIAEDSAWGALQEIMKDAKNHYEVLPRDSKKAEKALLDLQQSTKSLMGALVYETGGIFVDHGWIRILGSGSSKMHRSMTDWNKGRAYDEHGDQAGYLMVADDVLGGLFAVNGNELGDDTGNIYYLSPDALEWQPLMINLHELLDFFFKGDLNNLYEDVKWEGWQDEVKAITGDQAISVYPFLFSEGGPLIDRDRAVVSMVDHYEWMLDMSRQNEEFCEANEDEDGDCCGSDDSCCGEDDCGCGNDDDDEKGCCGGDDKSGGCGCGR